MAQNRRDFVKDEVKRLQTVIFDCRYACRLMQRDQYDVETLENRGIPVTGIDWMDNLADEQHVHRLLTINDMVEYASKRINFWLDEPQIYATIIYKSITDYIEYYAELSDIYPNLPIPDQEDFEKLDNFAATIFRLHRCYEKEVELKGFLGRLRARRRAFTINGPVGMAKDQPLINEDGTVQQREHTSNLELLGYRFQARKEPNQ